MGIAEKKMEVSLIKEGFPCFAKKMEINIKKMVKSLFQKKRWMKDKRWIKDGNRASRIPSQKFRLINLEQLVE